jgi:hypothetical protein
MHMLFKGIKGVYACANEHCSHAHEDETLSLGEIFLSDGRLVCPHCHSVVYELYNDRRCGALFVLLLFFTAEGDFYAQNKRHRFRQAADFCPGGDCKK